MSSFLALILVVAFLKKSFDFSVYKSSTEVLDLYFTSLEFAQRPEIATVGLPSVMLKDVHRL